MTVQMKYSVQHPHTGQGSVNIHYSPQSITHRDPCSSCSDILWGDVCFLYCSVGYFMHTHTTTATTTTTMNLPTNSERPAVTTDILYAQPSPSHTQGFHKCAQKHQRTHSSLVFHLPPSTRSHSRSWGAATL